MDPDEELEILRKQREASAQLAVGLMQERDDARAALRDATRQKDKAERELADLWSRLETYKHSHYNLYNQLWPEVSTPIWLSGALNKLPDKEVRMRERLKHPDMRCGSCDGRLIWDNSGSAHPAGGSYTHTGGMMDRHGAYPVEPWESE